MFLRSHHPYRRLKKAFNGHQEASGPPTPLTSVEVYEKVNNIEHTVRIYDLKREGGELFKIGF